MPHVRLFLSVMAVLVLCAPTDAATPEEEAFEHRSTPELLGVSMQMHPSFIAEHLENLGFKTRAWYLENGEHVRSFVPAQNGAPFSSVEMRFCSNPAEVVELFFISAEPGVYYPLLRDRLGFRSKDLTPDGNEENVGYKHYERLFKDGVNVDFGTDSSGLKLHLRMVSEERRSQCRSRGKAAADYLNSTRSQQDTQSRQAIQNSL